MSGEEWRKEYERSRYLHELPDMALQERFDALAGNLWSTNADGAVTAPRSSKNRLELLRLILHTKLEQMERDGTIFYDFDEREIRKTASASYKPPRLKTPFKGGPSCFAKYGKTVHIRDAFERGILRIAPASAYDDPSLNAAQADKELEHHTVTPNESIPFRVYGLNSQHEEVEIPVQRKELFRYMMVDNFYVWCCSFGYDARLFHEFNADAVLVVRNRESFRNRLRRVLDEHLPEATGIDEPLQYYDPYTVRREQLRPIFGKDVRYLYQNEY